MRVTRQQVTCRRDASHLQPHTSDNLTATKCRTSINRPTRFHALMYAIEEFAVRGWRLPQQLQVFVIAP
jgi:hypothetical protein